MINGIPLGVQLWSVKNDLSKDVDTTLKALADTGFSMVETAGYDPEGRTVFGMPPKTFLTKLQQFGLRWVSAHVPVSVENIKSILDDFAFTGIEYLVCSMYPDADRRPDDYRRIAEQYNRVGLTAKTAGIQFGYHNHHFEFDPLRGEKPFEILLNGTDPKLVVFEMDLGWVVQAANDPLEFFTNHPGRFPLWHLRDVDQNGQSVNAGAGLIDFHSLFQHKNEAGFIYGIVETPSAAADGLARVTACYDYFEKGQW